MIRGATGYKHVAPTGFGPRGTDNVVYSDISIGVSPERAAKSRHEIVVSEQPGACAGELAFAAKSSYRNPE
jgi:hypothetical protein